MQSRAVRRILVALLVAAVLVAAYATFDAHTRLLAGIDVERDVQSRLDRLAAAAAALGSMQQAYVAPGQRRGDALTRASVLVQQIYDDIAALRLRARSADAASSLLAFGKATDALVNVDDRVREHLRLEQEIMAADLVYTEARQALDAMAAPIESLKTAERRLAEGERRALLVREATVLAAAVLVGLIVLLVLPQGAPAGRPAAELQRPAAADSEETPPIHPIDLTAAAMVCSELSRVSSATALTPALTRAARVLDASGLIVWLGAGEELHPAAAYGYGPRTLTQFGPIPRAESNATASTWRSGQMAVVQGAPGSNGAIVAPLLSQGGCFGVLAAEVRHGREGDEAARAVAAMFAAQLSTVIAPWPAPSEIEDPAEPAAAEETAASA